MCFFLVSLLLCLITEQFLVQPPAVLYCSGRERDCLCHFQPLTFNLYRIKFCKINVKSWKQVAKGFSNSDLLLNLLPLRKEIERCFTPGRSLQGEFLDIGHYSTITTKNFGLLCTNPALDFSRYMYVSCSPPTHTLAYLYIYISICTTSDPMLQLK